VQQFRRRLERLWREPGCAAPPGAQSVSRRRFFPANHHEDGDAKTSSSRLARAFDGAAGAALSVTVCGHLTVCRHNSTWDLTMRKPLGFDKLQNIVALNRAPGKKAAYCILLGFKGPDGCFQL
jgi:hypothetical protein